MSTNDLVLVTGGTGFLASHCILQLFEQGYRVRTTIRKLTRADDVRKMLKAGGAGEEQVSGVEFRAVDLGNDDGWTEACEGCTYVLHVASPFPLSTPKHEDDLIVPAREGTLRALRAAKLAGTVKRVVVTSSLASIVSGRPDQTKPFTEEDWSDLSGHVEPYSKSKTIAERAAWDWVAKEGGDMQLTVINPVGIFGPLLGKDYAASCEIIIRLMNGALPGLPNFYIGVVDVRDVADLHLRAMTNPKAAGQRYIAASPGDVMSFRDIANVLRSRMGDKAKKVPTRGLPDWLLRLVAVFDASVALIVPDLGKVKNATSEKAVRELGWQPRSKEDAVVATAESMVTFGLLK